MKRLAVLAPAAGPAGDGAAGHRLGRAGGFVPTFGHCAHWKLRQQALVCKALFVGHLNCLG